MAVKEEKAFRKTGPVYDAAAVRGGREAQELGAGEILARGGHGDIRPAPAGGADHVPRPGGDAAHVFEHVLGDFPGPVQIVCPARAGKEAGLSFGGKSVLHAGFHCKTAAGKNAGCGLCARDRALSGAGIKAHSAHSGSYAERSRGEIAVRAVLENEAVYEGVGVVHAHGIFLPG